MPFEYQSLTDHIYQHIKELIVTNGFKPGERLQEQELADQLNVSRTPVREAISRLGAEGLLTIIPRRGVFVTKPCTKDIKDIYEVREALEVLAVELLVPKLTDRDIKNLQQLIDDFKKSFDEKQFEKCFELDRKFHDQIIKLSQNSKIVDFNTQMGAFVSVTRLMHCDDEGLQARTCQEHIDILNALTDRDLKSAVHYMRQHIRRVKNDLVEKHENSQEDFSSISK